MRIILSLVVVISIGLVTHAGDKVDAEKPLKLTLSAKTKTIKAGEKPTFVLTIENRGKDAERLVNGNKPGLHSWYHVSVTQNGKPVELTSILGIPAFPQDKEDGFLVLKAGEKVEFELSNFWEGIEGLGPGKYAARISFGTWPEKGKDVDYVSPPAEFVVEK